MPVLIEYLPQNFFGLFIGDGFCLFVDDPSLYLVRDFQVMGDDLLDVGVERAL